MRNARISKILSVQEIPRDEHTSQFRMEEEIYLCLHFQSIAIHHKFGRIIPVIITKAIMATIFTDSYNNINKFLAVFGIVLFLRILLHLRHH